MQSQTQQTHQSEPRKPNLTNAPPPHPDPVRHLGSVQAVARSLGLLLRVIVFLISLGLLLHDSVFDFTGCYGFCFDLCVFVFVLGKLSVKESSSHGIQVCETQVTIVKSNLRNL